MAKVRKIKQIQVEGLVEAVGNLNGKVVKDITITGSTTKVLNIIFTDGTYISETFVDLDTTYAGITVPLLNAGVDTQERTIQVKVLVDYINSKLASALRWKASVPNFSNLPTSGNQVGDVYNIENAFTYKGEQYPAGSNVVWSANGEWDVLHGFIDTSQFLTQEVDPKGVHSVDITGGSTKTITITLRDGSTVSGQFIDNDTTYQQGNLSELQIGTNTIGKVWSSNTLYTFVTGLIQGALVQVYQEMFPISAGNISAGNVSLVLQQSNIINNKIMVYLNGIKQPMSSHNINGSSLTLNQASLPTPIIVGDEVEVFYLD